MGHKLFRTTVTGSYPRPQQPGNTMKKPTLTRNEADEMIRWAVRDQVEAGLDVVTDGEGRRENMYYFFQKRLDGLSFDEMEYRKYGPLGFGIDIAKVIGRIENPRIELARDWKVARDTAPADVEVKLTCTGPHMLWLFYYFGQVRHIASQQTATYTTLIWLSWAAMTPVGGWISDRALAAYGPVHGRRLVPVFALSVSALLLYLATSTQNPITMVSLLCIALGCAAATEGPFWVVASEIGGTHAAAAAGIMNTGGSIGGFLAPVITPFLATKSGWPAALYTGSAIVLVAVILWFFVNPGAKAQQEYAKLAFGAFRSCQA